MQLLSCEDSFPQSPTMFRLSLTMCPLLLSLTIATELTAASLKVAVLTTPAAISRCGAEQVVSLFVAGLIDIALLTKFVLYYSYIYWSTISLVHPHSRLIEVANMRSITNAIVVLAIANEVSATSTDAPTTVATTAAPTTAAATTAAATTAATTTPNATTARSGANSQVLSLLAAGVVAVALLN